MATKIKGDEEVEKTPKAASDKPIGPKVKAGGHIAPANMRKEVAGKPLEDLSEDPDSVRAPYPQGSPRDPADIFEEGHGYRKAE